MRFSLALLMGLCTAGAAFAQAIEVQDVRGKTIRLAQPAQRIVTLAPHLVENLFVIGAGGQIVGTLADVDFPPEAAGLPEVGAYNSISAEAILQLQPDLVLGWASGNSAAVLAQLEDLGLTLYLDEPRGLDDVASGLETLGRLTGRAVEGRRHADELRARRDALALKYAHQKPVSVFYQVWHDPLQTLNGKHVLNDLIQLCGGRNVFAEAVPLAPRVSVESVLQKAPEVILASGPTPALAPDLSHWRRWSQLPAVKTGQLHAIRGDWVLRFTPRLLLGAQELCEILEAAR